MAAKSAKSKKKSKKSSAKAKAELKRKLALKETRAQEKVLKSAVRQLQAQLKAERKDGSYDPIALQSEVSRAQKGLEKVQSELDQTKAMSRKRKDEIDEWKAWYERLPDESKMAGMVNLQNEIAWRAGELDSNTEKISLLQMDEMNYMGAMENAKYKLMAFEEGVHKLPLEKDPRLKGLQKRLKATQARIKRHKR